MYESSDASISHLSLFDVFLFVDFSQAKFAFLLIEGTCSGVVIWFLLWLDTSLHIIPGLVTEYMSENTATGCQFVFFFVNLINNSLLDDVFKRLGRFLGDYRGSPGHVLK